MVLKVNVFLVTFQKFETAFKTTTLADISFLLLNARFQSFSNYFRRSHWRCSMKKDILKNFEKFIGKHFCLSLVAHRLGWNLHDLFLNLRLWVQTREEALI